MTQFAHTDAAQNFIDSAASRETSPQIMQAIVFFARNEQEAQAIWEGDGLGTHFHASDFWEAATNNGAIDAEDLYWGASGSRWWAQMQELAGQ